MDDAPIKQEPNSPPGRSKWPCDAQLFGNADDTREETFFRRMLMIRRFEERLLQLFDEGVLNGTTHCCIGQEANSVGVIEQLRAGDHVFSNHRCHGHFLAWTGDAFGLLAEIMGRRAGVCGGKGGSQHLCVEGFKSNGILGGTVPNAAGLALAAKLRGGDAISVVFTGDGALGEGVIYETMNLASLWELPLLFVVENNEWSQSTPIRLNFAGTFAGRFAAFGIECEELASTDVTAIAEVAVRAVAAVRSSRKPRALVLHTYRFCHHSKNDDSRSPGEIEERRKLDPLLIHGPRLSDERHGAVSSEVEAALADIIARARSTE